MTATATALYKFYSSFGLPAFQADTVPDDAALPYITYSYVEPEWETSATHYAQVFMRTNSNEALLAKAGQIVRAIGTRKDLKCDGGYVVLHPASPLVQIMHDSSNDDIRIAYINLQLDALHTPGV